MPRTSPRPQTQVRQIGPAVDVGTKGLRTKTRILVEAKRLMLEKGYDATTISDITEASGIRRASFSPTSPASRTCCWRSAMTPRRLAWSPQKVYVGWHRHPRSRTSRDWVDEYFAFWDKHGSFVYAAFQAAYADPELREWSVNAEMVGATSSAKHGQASWRQARARRRSLVQGLAIQSMMERFWYHWRVAGAPVKQSAIAYSIAHLIWASAHAG